MASADLLGPYGEGYCGRCQFVVGLDPKGRLDWHRRGSVLDHQGYGTACKGSGRRPWKRTPYASRKNIFRFRVPLLRCPVCAYDVPVQAGFPSGLRLKLHYPDDTAIRWCTGSNQRVVGRRVMMPVSR